MPKGYQYEVRLRDTPYFRALVDRDVATSDNPCLGITEYPDRRIIVWFDKKLTTTQKRKLDSLVNANPVPASVYIFSPITPEDVEADVGVKPVKIDYFPEVGTIICYFDTTLTSDQETKLEALLRSPMKFKRRTL